jgi:hypothetical protein
MASVNNRVAEGQPFVPVVASQSPSLQRLPKLEAIL